MQREEARHAVGEQVEVVDAALFGEPLDGCHQRAAPSLSVQRGQHRERPQQAGAFGILESGHADHLPRLAHHQEVNGRRVDVVDGQAGLPEQRPHARAVGSPRRFDQEGIDVHRRILAAPGLRLQSVPTAPGGGP